MSISWLQTYIFALWKNTAGALISPESMWFSLRKLLQSKIHHLAIKSNFRTAPVLCLHSSLTTEGSASSPHTQKTLLHPSCASPVLPQGFSHCNSFQSSLSSQPLIPLLCHRPGCLLAEDFLWEEESIGNGVGNFSIFCSDLRTCRCLRLCPLPERGESQRP